MASSGSDPMTESFCGAREILLRQGNRYFREQAPPKQVQLRIIGSAAVAVLDFDRVRRHAVVKRAVFDGDIFTPEQLLDVHERIRSRSPSLAAHMPRFLGYDRDTRYLILEYIEGETLLSILRKSLWVPGSQAQADTLLRETARFLAEVCKVPASEVGLTLTAPRSNQNFLPNFQKRWNNPRIQPFIPRRFRSPNKYLEHFPESFFQRPIDSIAPLDTQPKNYLIQPPGKPFLIDLDYTCHSPAMTLAYFLVSLDRIGLKFPWAISSSAITAWKRSVVTAYLEAADPHVCEELLFYYPLILLLMLELHVEQRPRWRPLLFWYYGGRLRRFLTSMEGYPAKSAGVTAFSL